MPLQHLHNNSMCLQCETLPCLNCMLCRRRPEPKLRWKVKDMSACTWPLHLFEDVTALLIEHTVNPTQGILRTLDFHKVNGLSHPRLSCQLGRIDGSSASGDDLSTSPVDGIRMKYHITHLQLRVRTCSIGCGCRNKGCSAVHFEYCQLNSYPKSLA